MYILFHPFKYPIFVFLINNSKIEVYNLLKINITCVRSVQFFFFLLIVNQKHLGHSLYSRYKCAMSMLYIESDFHL